MRHSHQALTFIAIIYFTSVASLKPALTTTRQLSRPDSPSGSSSLVLSSDDASPSQKQSPPIGLSSDQPEEPSDALRALGRNKRKYELSDQRKRPDDEPVYGAEDAEEVGSGGGDDEGFCVMGNICGSGGGIAGDSSIPCHAPRRPSQLNDTEARATLRNICPDLFATNDNPAVCCTPDQIRETDQNLASPRDLGMGKCPSCYHNFKNLHCQMICSPRQQRFLQVTNRELVDEKEIVRLRAKAREDDDEEAEKPVTEKSIEKREEKSDQTGPTNKTDQYAIVEVSYFVDKNFVVTLYESCKNVKSVMGGMLIDVLCGTPPCSPTKWLKFMGTSYLKKGFSPIQINYVPVEGRYYANLDQLISVNAPDNRQQLVASPNLSNLTAIQPFSTRGFKCYERINSENGPCVCADCERTCDALTQKALPHPSRQQALSGQDFTIFLGWLLFAMVFVGVFAYFLLVAIRKRRTYSRK